MNSDNNDLLVTTYIPIFIKTFIYNIYRTVFTACSKDNFLCKYLVFLKNNKSASFSDNMGYH